ncbi:MAG: flagellar biosynthesis protein FlhF [Gammaproteobacteria bacterium]|nr:flagellar biosynthesis protein FlhF [Gammaproteobacteria bacterium]
MQVKRFVADDMRTAMRLVKEEIGADAVILSNRVVNGKVEILAARDYDESLINKALDKTLVESKPDSAAAYYERAAAERALQNSSFENATVEKSSTDELVKNIAVNPPVAQDNDVPLAKQFIPEKELESVATLKNNKDHQAAGLYPSQLEMQAPLTDSMVEMRDELKSLRAMIENQHVLGEWKEMASKHPLRVSLYKRLTEMGLSQDVCKYLAKGLDNSADVEQAMQAALKQLVHQIPLAEDDILNQGGVFAMVGPTGVGKTTTIAKLAARFAMQHGQRHVALISTDTYRIGAHEQLMTYGRLLGVPVHSANDTQQLQQLLHKLHDKKLVLIDTAGMSQRDIDISQQLAHLSHPSSMIKTYLVLSANAQTSTLDEVITAFRKASPAGCILTKLDEAASLGGALSAVIKHQLPIAYISDGQKVPEDIKPARARELVDDTLAYSRQYKQSTDDEFMAVAFTTGIGHAPL